MSNVMNMTFTILKFVDLEILYILLFNNYFCLIFIVHGLLKYNKNHKMNRKRLLII